VRTGGGGAAVDPASLAVYRAGFGAVLVWWTARYVLAGRIGQYYLEPEVHFGYLGFGWVRPWPGPGMYIHFAALGALALAVAVGFKTRLCAALFALGFAYVFLLEQARYLNHSYLIILLALMLAALPAGRAFGLDARLRGPASAPRWSLSVMRAQLGLVYLFAGIAKLNRDWLRARPLDEWIPARADTPVLGPLLAHPSAPWVFSYGGLVIDLFAWPLLVFRPTRVPAFVLLATFHLTNATLFGIGVFPWLMLVATTLFFDPDWPCRVLRRTRPSPVPSIGSWTRVLIALWFTLQVALPLRHFLYPGYVSWTEEGHMFAWHMKLRDKEGRATFVVERPDGQTLLVDPRLDLTDWQARKLCGRPDLVVQYAHHLAEKYTVDDRRPVVRANVSASVNGRPLQPLIDSSIDLAGVRRGLGHAKWIVPLREE
jgi:hypothetical protein